MADIIRAGVLWGFGPLVRSLGHDPGPLLTEAGISVEAMDDPDNYLLRRSVVGLLDATASRLNCRDFGLRLAEMHDASIFGALAFVMRKAPDLRGALRSGAKYAHFHCPAVRLTIEPVAGAAEDWIVISWDNEKTVSGIQFVEHAIGLACRVCRQLAGGAFSATRVQFSHQAFALPAAYESLLGLTPKFGRDFNAIALARPAFSLRLKGTDRQFQAIVERYVEMHSPAAGQNAGRQVHQAIGRIMRQGLQPTMTDVAEMLHVHPRTLQRRLSQEGVTFEQVRDEVRRDLAEVYLAHDVIPLVHVTEMLGYANQSALTRSSLRWFGATPQHVRRQFAARRR